MSVDDQAVPVKLWGETPINAAIPGRCAMGSYVAPDGRHYRCMRVVYDGPGYCDFHDEDAPAGSSPKVRRPDRDT